MSDEYDLRGTLVTLVSAAVVMAAIAGLAFAVTNGVNVSGDIALNASDGPNVTFANRNTNVNLTDPFPNSNTVKWEGDDGNITLSASGDVAVTVDQIEGSQTKLSNIGDGPLLTVNPDDKQAIRVKDADSLDFRSMTIDDNIDDFTISGSGTATLNITGLPADRFIKAVNSSGTELDRARTNAIGEVQLKLPLSTHTVRLQNASGGASAPGLQNPNPQGEQTDFPTTLSVDVSDNDFPNDKVTVEFEHNGVDVGSDTLTSAGTASTTISTPPRGLNTVNVTATDDFGRTSTLNYTFSTPRNLTVRDAEAPDTIIDDRQVNATFFINDSIVRRSTNNGNISMDGLPIDQPVSIRLNASQAGALTPAHYNRVTSATLTFTKQKDVYMIPTSVSTSQITFTLDDQTGGVFAENDPAVQVDEPINRSGWSQPRWEAVYGDTFGAEGTTATLKDNQRYRIRVINDQGAERVLGAYTPQGDAVVNLQVGSVSAGPTEPDTNWAANATFNTSGQDRIRFAYNDSEFETDLIYLKIYEFNNESNVLAQNQTFVGPYGSFSYSEPVPQSRNDTNWVVDATIVRGNNSFSVVQPVGPQSPVLPGMGTRVKTMISIGTILIVAGLFSQLNGHVGGLVVAGLGGLFWFVDFLPEGTSIGIVVLAMIAAGIIFVRERTSGSVTT